MPAFVRSGGQWVETVPRARSGAAWTDEDDQLFARQSAQWKLIYPDPADAGDLLPVEGLAVTSGPTSFSVTIGWTNPTQPTITPTAVQVRIAELGAVWTELDYPTTSAAWGALDAATEYLAQVRLIRRVDGLVTDVSPTRSVQFTTDVAPVGAPAEDPGSPGGTDTDFPVTIPIGGSPGGGDPVSTPDGCWGEYKIQILDLDTTTIDWQDTGIVGTFSGALTSFSFDTSVLDNTRTYRTCVREACDTNTDGVADTFGDWSCSAPYPGNFDWGVTCGAIPLAPVVQIAAAADAVWAFPRYCNIDNTGIEMVDAISNTQIGKGADFVALYANATGEWGVVADADGGITMTAGLAAVASTIGAGLDFSIVVRRRFSPGHTLSNGRTTTIASIGQGAIVVQIVETATGWYPTVAFRLTSGYVVLTGASSEKALDSSVHTIALRWDADGDKRLALDAIELDADTSGDDLHGSVEVQSMYWTAETGFGTTMQQIGWDRVLTDEELVSISPAPAEVVGLPAGLNNVFNASSITLTLPTHAEGDLLVLLLTAENVSTAPPTPSGWTEMYSIDGGGINLGLLACYKFAGASESNPTVTLPATSEASGQVIALRGISTSSPLDVALPTATVAGGDMPRTPTITTVTDGCVLLSWHHSSASGDIGQPAPSSPNGYLYVPHGDLDTAIAESVACCYQEQATAGEQLGWDSTAFSGSAYYCMTAAFRPG